MSATLHCGDVRTVLASLPDASVRCCVTSPPYFGLRDYGTGTWLGGDAVCSHQEVQPQNREGRETPGGRGGTFPTTERAYRHLCGKCGARRVDQQLGLEPTPDAYVAAMVEVFRAVRRVLRDDGTLFLNIGDSYCSTAPGTMGDALRQDGILAGVSDRRAAASRKLRPETPTGMKPKDLIGIPWLLAFALRADGWYLRSEIIWHKPNPMPESVTDRPTKSHEQVFLLSKGPKYFYDAQAIAEPNAEFLSNGDPNPRARYGGAYPKEATEGVHYRAGGGRSGQGYESNGTRNARTVWSIATQPYSGAHFATMPEELARRCILAGSSAKACEHCGAAWERVVERGPLVDQRTNPGQPAHLQPQGYARAGKSRCGVNESVEDRGWQPTCACADNTGSASDTVLDPFGGSGTTAAVAVGHGRRAIHIDLNPAYMALARDRIGPMLCTEPEAA